MSFTKTTEQDSHYNHLEKMSAEELIQKINQEDQTVALAVEKSLSQVVALTNQIVDKFKS